MGLSFDQVINFVLEFNNITGGIVHDPIKNKIFLSKCLIFIGFIKYMLIKKRVTLISTPEVFTALDEFPMNLSRSFLHWVQHKIINL